MGRGWGEGGERVGGGERGEDRGEDGERGGQWGKERAVQGVEMGG